MQVNLLSEKNKACMYSILNSDYWILASILAAFYYHSAPFAAVAGRRFCGGINFVKISAPHLAGLKTFRAAVVAQLTRGYGQMAVPALKPGAWRGQQSQYFVAAGAHILL